MPCIGFAWKVVCIGFVGVQKSMRNRSYTAFHIEVWWVIPGINFINESECIPGEEIIYNITLILLYKNLFCVRSNASHCRGLIETVLHE